MSVAIIIPLLTSWRQERCERAPLAENAVRKQYRVMRLLVAMLLVCLSAPAFAAWRLDGGVAIVEPVDSNSTVEAMAMLCGDPFFLEIYSRDGPVMPASGNVAADYFYQPGKVRAVIDGTAYPLAAAGSELAVVLFEEGTEKDGYLAPIRLEFVEALKSGSTVTFGFDITSQNAPDGSAFETFATFPLEGARPVLDEALAACL